VLILTTTITYKILAEIGEMLEVLHLLEEVPQLGVITTQETTQLLGEIEQFDHQIETQPQDVQILQQGLVIKVLELEQQPQEKVGEINCLINNFSVYLFYEKK
jgi:N-acetylglutamate synthase-like GNAT family acetyltransferase